MTRTEIIRKVDRDYATAFNWTADPKRNGGLAEEWRAIDEIAVEVESTGEIRDDCDAVRYGAERLSALGVPLNEMHLVFARLDGAGWHLLLLVQNDGDLWRCCDNLGPAEPVLQAYEKHELIKARRMDQTVRDWRRIEWPEDGG